MDKEDDKKKNNEKLTLLMNALRKRLYSESDKLSSKKIGEKGIELILNNDFMGALQYFKQGLSMDPKDARHYLNSSYCHLKLRKYALALADVTYVLKESDVPAYLFIANLRAGQAASGLMEYKKAESFFKAAISIDLDNPYPRREFMRLKINCLINAGYSERDALSTIEMSSTIDEILSLPTDNLKVQSDLQISDNPNDEYEYSSDDDESSNFNILNRILNYEPSKMQLKHIANNLSTVSKKNTATAVNNNSENKNSTQAVKQNSSIPNSPSKQTKTPLPEKKSELYFDNIKSLEMPNPNNKRTVVNNYAIWVGNLSHEITETMLRTLFSQYGSITHVHRPVDANYAFVNFLDKQSVRHILQFSYYHLYGCTLVVRPSIISIP